MMFQNINGFNGRVNYAGIDINKTKSNDYSVKFPLKYNGCLIYDKPLCDNGLLRLVNYKHANDFFYLLEQKCKKENMSDLYHNFKTNRYGHYREDNLYVSLVNLEPNPSESTPQEAAKARRFKKIALFVHKQTIPENVIIFPYIGNTSFKEWPPGEQKRFAQFCKAKMTKKEYTAFSTQVFGEKVEVGLYDNFTVALAEWNVANPGKMAGEIRKNIVLGPPVNDKTAMQNWMAPYRKKIAKGEVAVCVLSVDGGRVAVIPNNMASKLYAGQLDARYSLYAWGDKTFHPDNVANVNFIEKGFSKIDLAVAPALSGINFKEGRLALLGLYGAFMSIRNLPNPLSWYTFLASLTQLHRDLGEMVKAWNYGTDDERAMLVGQIAGLIYGMRGLKAAQAFFAKNKIALVKGRVRIIPKQTTAAVQTGAVQRGGKPKAKVEKFKGKTFLKNKGPKKPSGGTGSSGTKPAKPGIKKESVGARMYEKAKTAAFRAYENIENAAGDIARGLSGPRPAYAGAPLQAAPLQAAPLQAAPSGYRFKPQPSAGNKLNGARVLFSKGARKASGATPAAAAAVSHAPKGINPIDVIKALIVEDNNKVNSGKLVKNSSDMTIYRHLKKMRNMTQEELAEIARELNQDVKQNPGGELNKLFRQKHEGEITVDKIREVIGMIDKTKKVQPKEVIKALLLADGDKESAGRILEVENGYIPEEAGRILGLSPDQLEPLAREISAEWQEYIGVEEIKKVCRIASEKGKGAALLAVAESPASEWLLTGRKRYTKAELLLVGEEFALLRKIIGDKKELSWTEIYKRLVEYAEDNKAKPREPRKDAPDKPQRQADPKKPAASVWQSTRKSMPVAERNAHFLQMPDVVMKLLRKINQVCDELNINKEKLKLELKGEKIFAFEKKPVNQRILDYMVENPNKVKELDKMDQTRQAELIAGKIGEEASSVKAELNTFKYIFREFGENYLSNILKEYEAFRETGKLPQKWMQIKDLDSPNPIVVKLLKQIAGMSEAELRELDNMPNKTSIAVSLADAAGETTENIQPFVGELMRETGAESMVKLGPAARRLVNGEKIQRPPARLFDVIGRDSIRLKILKYLADAPEEELIKLKDLSAEDFISELKNKDIVAKDAAVNTINGEMRELKVLTGTDDIMSLAQQCKNAVYEGKIRRRAVRLEELETKKCDTVMKKFLNCMANLTEEELTRLSKMDYSKAVKFLSKKAKVNNGTLFERLAYTMKVYGVETPFELAAKSKQIVSGKEVAVGELTLFDLLNTEKMCIGKIIRYLSRLTGSEIEAIKKLDDDIFYKRLSKQIKEKKETVIGELSILQKRTGANNIVEMINASRNLIKGKEVARRDMGLLDIAKVDHLHIRVLKYLNELPDKEVLRIQNLPASKAAAVIAKGMGHNKPDSITSSISQLRRIFRKKDLTEIVNEYKKLLKDQKILGQSRDRFFAA